jgi:GNAT superfamily N-acetyltransferase
MTSFGVRQAVRPPPVEVVRATDGHVECLAEFFRAVWDPAATPERVREARAAAAASNPTSPGEAAPTFLFLLDGRALGHVTTIPIRLWSGRTERPAHWLKGLMVLPEYRNGPVGFSVLKEATRHLGCALGLAVQPAAWRLFEALNFAHLGALSNHLCVLRPARVLRLDVESMGLPDLPPWLQRAVRAVRRQPIAAVVGAGVRAMMQVWTAAAHVRTLGLCVSWKDQEVDPAELDALWERARRSMAAAPVRDGRYVRWRYASGDGAPYSFLTVREQHTLVGFAVVRCPSNNGDPRLGGLRVATLSDLLFAADRTDVALAVLAGAEAIARYVEADALLCSVSHAKLRAILPWHAYLPLPGTLHFVARDPEGAYALPPRLAEWWLTRGDADADGVF